MIFLSVTFKVRFLITGDTGQVRLPPSSTFDKDWHNNEGSTIFSFILTVGTNEKLVWQS